MQAALSSFSRKVGYQLSPVQKGSVLPLKGKCFNFTEPSGPISLHERYIPHHTQSTTISSFLLITYGYTKTRGCFLFSTSQL